MIVTSSTGYATPIFGVLTYSATKRFVTHLSQGLNIEFDGKIDVMSFNPGYVKTKLIDDVKSQEGVLTCQKAVSKGFRDLGYEVISNGAFEHECVDFLLKSHLSSSVIKYDAKNIIKD